MMRQTPKKNLAILGASYLQLPLIEKAKALGFCTHVFAWQANDVGEQAADYFYPISIIEKEAVLAECRRIGICGICSIASDLAVITVNYVAGCLGLMGNSASCTLKSTNKYAMRKALQEGGDPIPRFRLLTEQSDLADPSLSFPAVIKPTDRSGSRGVWIAASITDAYAALEDALKESFEHRALIEEYVEGDEYSLEGISFQGTHQILAITKKFTTDAPRFIETGHAQPALLDPETAEKARSVVLHALDTLEIRNGASHSEIRIGKDGTIKIMEIGARMGGDLIGSDLVPLTTGIDYTKAVIQIACGQAPDLRPEHAPVPAAVRYILTREDANEMQTFREKFPDRFVKLAFLDTSRFEQANDSSGRAGCYVVIDEAK